MVVPCDPKRTAGFSFPGGLHSYLWVELCSLSQSDRIPDNYNIEQGGLSGVGLNTRTRIIFVSGLLGSANYPRWILFVWVGLGHFVSHWLKIWGLLGKTLVVWLLISVTLVSELEVVFVLIIFPF